MKTVAARIIAGLRTMYIEIFCFILFVEAELVNAIDCNPVLRGTRNHPNETL